MSRLKEMDRSLKVKSITDKLHTSGVVLDKIIDKLNIGSKAKRKAGLKSGGRASFKHGKYVKVPTPHADIAKYVEKDSSKSPEHFRKEGSTLKMGKKSAGRGGRRALAQRPAALAKKAKMIELFREGPRNEKFGLRVKRSLGGAATHGFNTKILRTE